MNNIVLYNVYKKLNLINNNKQLFYLVWSYPLIFFTQHNYFRDYHIYNKDVYIHDFIKQNKECIVLSSGANWYWNDNKYRPNQHNLTVKGLNQFRLDYPNTRIILLHPDESFIEGYPSTFEYINFNRNALIDIQSYNIIEDSKNDIYDAIYNANFYRYKRHDLIENIDELKIGLIYYHRIYTHNTAYYIDNSEIKYGLERESVFKNKKNFYLLNYFNGKYNFLDKAAVNNYYNQSKCGLCLSDIEGACLVSVEYFLAGIPVISVKNDGGRDKFLKQMGEYSITDVNPDTNEIEYYIRKLNNMTFDRDSIRKRILYLIDKEWLELFDQLDNIGIYINNKEIFRDNFINIWKFYKL